MTYVHFRKYFLTVHQKGLGGNNDQPSVVTPPLVLRLWSLMAFSHYKEPGHLKK